MLLRCRDLWNACYIAMLPRSLECFLRYLLLRCQDLWNARYVTCCYAAEISGMLSTLHVATLPRSLECLLHCYAAEISGMLATLPRSHVICQNVAMALRHKYKKLLQKTADMLQKLEWKKDASFCPIEMKKKFVFVFYCDENNISPKNTQIWTSKFVTFPVTQIVTSLWKNTHCFWKTIFSWARFSIRRVVYG